jgi:hypothetical protein
MGSDLQRDRSKSPLVDALIKKTTYYRGKLVKKLFNKHIASTVNGIDFYGSLERTGVPVQALT